MLGGWSLNKEFAKKGKKAFVIKRTGCKTTKSDTLQVEI